MSKNNNLLKAKKEANDEFYTQYEDIAKEIEHYKEHLKGKVVYCNCDIPHFSNFHKYFLDNFKELELKKLIVTGYVKNGNGKNYHGWYGEGDLSNPITPFTLIKVG